MKIHHVGYLVKSMISAEEKISGLGFCREASATYDPLRKINISFWLNGGYRVELIEPAEKDSPFYPLLKRYKNTPYHFCYEVGQLEDKIGNLEAQGYRLIQGSEKAPCIGDRRAAFLMDPDIGIIELLEEVRGGEALIGTIGRQDPLQRKALSRLSDKLGELDWKELDDTVEFYMRHWTLEELADAYLMFVHDTMKKADYFARTGRYRYSTFREVEEKVYQNRSYMSKYMVGLSLSSCLWENHLKLKRWFEKKINQLKGKNYLEIGPGHGKYFCMAVNGGQFVQYDAVDVSESSITQTKEYLAHFCNNKDVKYRLIQEDFYRFVPEEQYDCLIAMEVLEHLEDPAGMLRKLVSCGRKGSHILLTVPINAPEVDHIYLFHNIREVEDMVQQAGIEILDCCYVTSREGISIEKAESKRFPVIAGILGQVCRDLEMERPGAGMGH